MSDFVQRDSKSVECAECATEMKAAQNGSLEVAG